MFFQKKDLSVICLQCNTRAMRLKEYEAMENRNNPDWFWEPTYPGDDFLYKCPKCKKEDFISDSEFSIPWF